MRKLILFLSLLFVPGIPSLYAQVEEAVIHGTVIDLNSSQPIEFASVQLLKQTDSSIVQTTVTDKKGRFSFEKIPSGSYVISCSFIGYSKSLQPLIVDQEKENAGNISISTLATSLNEVTVTGRRSLLNTSIDRKVYQVSQDIMAQSGSASDILRNIPSIEVDIEGNVLLRGSGDMMILINGRPSPLMGRNRAEALQQLPANSIERIEVITNPSAKYRPDGTSGIINIVLKKNTKLGWNGAAIATVGSNNRYSTGLSLNYKPGKLNLSGNYNLRRDRRYRTNTSNREYFDNSGRTESFYTELGESLGKPLTHMAGLGAEYELNARNLIGLSGNYYRRKQTRNETSERFFFDPARQLTFHFNRLRYDPEEEKEKDLTAFWQHRFKEEDHELRTELMLSSSSESENSRFTNIFYQPVQPTSFDNIRQRDKEGWQEFSIEYSKPLKEDAKIETGYEGVFNQFDMDIHAEYLDTNQHLFVKDWNKSSLFKYKGAFHALYGVYEKGYEKFGYSVGLRAEQAYIFVHLVSKDTQARNQYFKIYPTLHLSYQLEKGELQLNYSKRVNRPDGDELSPFSEYRDPYTLYAGNPQLLPEIIHSVEFGYKIQGDKFGFVPSLYYRYKTNGFTTVTRPLNDTVLLTTEENLGTDHSAGLELIFSAKAGKFLTANLSTNLFYNQINAAGLGFENNRSIVAMSSQFNAAMNISPTTVGQLSSNFRSARLTLQGKSRASFVLNSGIRQELFKKKLSITLTISDILRTQRQETHLNSPFVKQITTGRRDARVVYFGISYRFGKTPKKANEEKLQFDDSL
jgi:outer membrane receptor protein involved in Fe transport